MNIKHSLQRGFAWGSSLLLVLTAAFLPISSAFAMSGQPDLKVHSIVNNQSGLSVKFGNSGARDVMFSELGNASLTFEVNGAVRYTYLLANLNSTLLRAGGETLVTPFTFGSTYLPNNQINKVRVCVDPAQVVSDANRSNNCMSQTFLNGVIYAPQPDLTVHGVSNSNGTLWIKVGNQGQRDVTSSEASNSTLTIVIDGTLRRTYQLSQLNAEFLARGNATVLTPLSFGSTYLSNNQDHVVTVCVDASNQIAESDETNNCKTSSMRNDVTPPPAPAPKPDLSVDSITTSGTDGNKYVQIKLRNHSTTAVEMLPGKSYTFDVYVDGARVYNYQWSTLSNRDFMKPLWSSVFVPLSQRHPALQSGGVHTIKACVDASNSVDESNESNNCLEERLSFPVAYVPPTVLLTSAPAAVNGEVSLSTGQSITFVYNIAPANNDLDFVTTWLWDRSQLDCGAQDREVHNQPVLNCTAIKARRSPVWVSVQARGQRAVESKVIYVNVVQAPSTTLGPLPTTVIPATPATPATPVNTAVATPPAGFEDNIVVATSQSPNPFRDTSMNAAEGRAAATLYNNAIIGGYPDGTFGGTRSVNRAEAAKFLLLARYGTIGDYSNSGRFNDVLDGQWYVRFVVRAAQLGIIQGYADGSFRPGAQVNTAEFLKMMSLTFGLPTTYTHGFTDVPATSWYAPYAGIATRYNLFPNRGTTLNPDGLLTRNEVVVAIYQYLVSR